MMHIEKNENMAFKTISPEICHAFKDVVGSAYVTIQKKMVEEAQTATFATHQQILAIVSPANKKEVRGCLEVANRFNVPIYPISTGKNWGYGSRVPVQDKSVLLALNRLKKIFDNG